MSNSPRHRMPPNSAHRHGSAPVLGPLSLPAYLNTKPCFDIKQELYTVFDCTIRDQFVAQGGQELRGLSGDDNTPRLPEFQILRYH